MSYHSCCGVKNFMVCDLLGNNILTKRQRLINTRLIFRTYESCSFLKLSKLACNPGGGAIIINREIASWKADGLEPIEPIQPAK